MRRFFIWLLTFLAAMLAVDISIGLIRKYILDSSELTIDAIEHLIINADEEIIIVGNSAGACHFDPVKMEDSLGMSCFNGATMGSSLRYNRVALTGLYAHHAPRILILALNPANFCENNLGHSSISFPPYYGRGGAELDSVIEELYPRRKYLFAFNMARNDRNILRAILYKSGLVGYPIKKGFQPLPAIWDAIPTDIRNDSVYIPHPAAIADLRQIASRCRREGTRLIVCIPPHCYASLDYSNVEKMIREVGAPYGVVFWNFSTIPLSRDGSLFYDRTHLNIKGAEIFTDTVIRRLRVMMPELSPAAPNHGKTRQ